MIEQNVPSQQDGNEGDMGGTILLTVLGTRRDHLSLSRDRYKQAAAAY